MIESLYRRGVLGVAESRAVAGFMKRQGFRMGVGRFVAGEDLEHALDAIRALERQGLYGILDLLGEFIDTEAGANAITNEIVATLDRLNSEPLDKYMSVKPTQLGLGVGLELALRNARRVARRAQEIGAHICLDMENVPYVDGTLALYRALHEEGYGNVSTVLQSYLYRSMDDLKALMAFNPALTVRIVKGAYREGPQDAYQKKADVDANYRAMARYGLEHGATVNIASHDQTIINELEALVRERRLGTERYEFQLLYGVRVSLQRELARRGHRVRIYVPYGEDWYGYFTRRLAERPANMLFVLRGLFG
jgi:proline dehydrogenase